MPHCCTKIPFKVGYVVGEGITSVKTIGLIISLEKNINYEYNTGSFI